MNWKIKSLILIVLIITLIYIVCLLNYDNYKESITGTYRNKDNSFNTIFFDASNGEYVEYIYNPATNNTLTNNGKFVQKNDSIYIVDGKYSEYTIEFKDNMLIISNDKIVLKFIKINDVPIELELS